MIFGFLGGSFDPIHLGHLQAAQIALEEGGFDKVFFLPTGHNWQKAQCHASIEERWACVQAVAASDVGLGALDTDLHRQGPIYTIDTVRLLRERYPHDQLRLIIGADQLANLHTWKEAASLCAEVAFFVLPRGGCALQAPQLAAARYTVASRQPLEVSSSQLRAQLAAGADVSALVPQCIIERVVHGYK